MQSPTNLVPHNGKLYGTTRTGGVYGVGTVFELTPPSQAGGAWAHRTIYSLNPATDTVAAGDQPVSTVLTFDDKGSIFCAGARAAFQLDPPKAPGGSWTHTVIYQFSANYYPSLVTWNKGSIYGTYNGPPGAVFQLTAPSTPGGVWTESVLHNFTGGSDGSVPMPDLVFDGSGNLHGTTVTGGSGANGEGNGTVYQLSPPASGSTAWTLSTLYTFTGGSDGSRPFTLTSGPSGSLYGVTLAGGITNNCDPNLTGCGVVFRLAPPSQAGGDWTESTVYSFSGGSNGATPNSLALASNGTIYGTNVSVSCGMVFELTPDGGGWNESTLYSFTQPGAESCTPTDVVIGPGGGPIVATGNNPYAFTPPSSPGGDWTATLVHNFAADSDGDDPAPNLAFDASGAIYGATAGGGPSLQGTVFKLTPPKHARQAWTETLLYEFSGGADGADPLGVIMDSAGNLYGTTAAGSSNEGTIYELTPPATPAASWTYSLIHAFEGQSDGARPAGALLLTAGGTIYGVTGAGGARGEGTVFSLTPSATPGGAPAYAPIYSFSTGAQVPNSGLIMDANGALYGTSGGPKYGAVFQLTPPATATGAWAETVLHVFTGGYRDGADPSGGLLVLDGEGTLYGTTSNGGGRCRGKRSAGCGVVYSIAPPALSGGAWKESVLYNFSNNHGERGAWPANVVLKAGSLYGVTSFGYGDAGESLFRLTPPSDPGRKWQETNLYSFTNQDQKAEGLIIHDGRLYGASGYGGSGQAGAIFEWK